LHRNELAHSLSLQNSLFQGGLARLQGLMALRTDAVDAMHRALKLLEGALDQQAALWSYVDDFRYLALACLATVPIGFALKKVTGKRVAVE
jgi:DHA2 family multidrug resistance protein